MGGNGPRTTGAQGLLWLDWASTTADVQTALHNAVNAVSAGQPIPKAIFPDQN
jgi:hypothetical protein